MNNSKMLFFISIIFLYSCQFKKVNELENTDLSIYMKKVHQIDLKYINQIVIFIPASTCDYCKESVISFLSKYLIKSNNVYIVLVGANNAELTDMKNRLSSNYKQILLDKGYKINQYFHSPSSYPFYYFIDGLQEVNQFEINGSNSEDIIEKLKMNLNSLPI